MKSIRSICGAAAVAALLAASPSFAALSTSGVTSAAPTASLAKYAAVDTYMYFQSNDSNYLESEDVDDDNWF